MCVGTPLQLLPLQFNGKGGERIKKGLRGRMFKLPKEGERTKGEIGAFIGKREERPKMESMV
ncbi:hypothetical protein GCM10010392_68940 [Streptomyces clavifer]|nr:hypothetical protein GCM10010392_68940 [Streptomyces clavifer]